MLEETLVSAIRGARANPGPSSSRTGAWHNTSDSEYNALTVQGAGPMRPDGESVFSRSVDNPKVLSASAGGIL